MRIIGKELSVSNLLAEAEKDRLFFDNSGGGITVGGGEPLVQAEFVYDLLKEAKRRDLHTALETCGYVKKPVFSKALEFCDLLLYDLKHMDGKKHMDGTGMDNDQILSNAKYAGNTVETIFRIPLIPGYNDDVVNLKETIDFAASIKKCRGIHILPYHKLGSVKYKALSRRDYMENIKQPTQEFKAALRKDIDSMNPPVPVEIL
jgi:pyruvate formate lyase activating enzyme